MKRIIWLALILFSSKVFAGWTDYGPITEINQQPGGSGHDVYIKADLPNNYSGCSDSSGYMLYVNDSADERIFSMLLAAFAAGKEVRLYFTANNCHPWNIAIVSGIYVKY